MTGLTKEWKGEEGRGERKFPSCVKLYPSPSHIFRCAVLCCVLFSGFLTPPLLSYASGGPQRRGEVGIKGDPFLVPATSWEFERERERERGLDGSKILLCHRVSLSPPDVRSKGEGRLSDSDSNFPLSLFSPSAREFFFFSKRLAAARLRKWGGKN